MNKSKMLITALLVVIVPILVAIKAFTIKDSERLQDDFLAASAESSSNLLLKGGELAIISDQIYALWSDSIEYIIFVDGLKCDPATLNAQSDRYSPQGSIVVLTKCAQDEPSEAFRDVVYKNIITDKTKLHDFHTDDQPLTILKIKRGKLNQFLITKL